MLPKQVIDKILSKAHMESGPVSNRDYQLIADDMLDSIGESLGVNTLKRLFGNLNENVTPSKSTLNVIARYLDYPDWNTCDAAIRDGVVCVVEDGVVEGYCEHLPTEYLSFGDRVEFRYDPNNKLLLEYMSGHRFRVIASTRMELQPADTLTIHYFQQGCAVVAYDLIRFDRRLPSPIRIAGSGAGISYLKCIRK